MKYFWTLDTLLQFIFPTESEDTREMMAPLARVSVFLLMIVVSRSSSKVKGGHVSLTHPRTVFLYLSYRNASRMRNIPVQTPPPVVLYPPVKVSTVEFTIHNPPHGCLPVQVLVVVRTVVRPAVLTRLTAVHTG